MWSILELFVNSLTHSLSLTILFLPILGALFLMCIPRENEKLLKVVGLSFSLLNFILSLFMWILFDKSTAKFQFVSELPWISSFFNIKLLFSFLKPS